MKRLGIDVDGVIANFVQGFFKISNRMYGTDFTEQLNWDFTQYTTEQVEQVWKVIKDTKDWWQTLRPLSGVNGLMYLPKTVEPVFITSRIPTVGHSVHDQTCAWLKSNFYITYPMVIVVDNPSEKIPLCKALGIDNFIDDKRSTILQMANAGLKSYAKLAPYNASEPFPEGVIPVEYLDEFLELETKGTEETLDIGPGKWMKAVTKELKVGS